MTQALSLVLAVIIIILAAASTLFLWKRYRAKNRLPILAALLARAYFAIIYIWVVAFLPSSDDRTVVARLGLTLWLGTEVANQIIQRRGGK